MNDVAIRVQNLGKEYRIGQRERYRSLRDSLAETLSAPVRWLGSLSSGHKPDNDNQEADTIWALRDISFEVKRGEVVGIIGRNGAGKSTLLKILSRITEPTTGEIEIRGRVGSLLEVGTGFHPELTGRENIYLNGAILGMKRAEIIHKFDEIVAFADIERFLDTPVKHYSSGMYMRLAFSVAAHLEPEILVVDEVLAVGDTQFQKKCLGKMGAVAKGGRTVLFVSHNMAAVQGLCQSAIRLQAGRLLGFRPVAEEVRAYQEEETLAAGVGNVARTVSKELEICRLTSSPHVVESCQRIRFTVSLRALTRLSLGQLSILLYSSLNVRVAIIDLRREEGPYSLAEGQLLTVSAVVDHLPLVEGEYQVGIGVQGGETCKEALDLTKLEILPRRMTGSVVPYKLVYRGYVELTHRICDVSIQ